MKFSDLRSVFDSKRSLDAESAQRVQALLIGGKELEAVQTYRLATRVSLAKAVSEVERLKRKLPTRLVV